MSMNFGIASSFVGTLPGFRNDLWSLKVGLQASVKIPNMPNLPNMRCNLATSFGTLTSDSFRRMDREMKAAIGMTVKKLSYLTDASYGSIIRCMNGNNYITQSPGTAVHRTDRLHKSGGGAFKFDGSPSQSIINEIRNWFIRLLSDADVYADTDIDINGLARMVAETGAGVDSFGSFFHRSIHDRKTALDVSILRFPDIDKPYFKVYRIHLVAYRDCERTLFVQHDSSGINGEYSRLCYSPVQSVIDRLRPAVIQDAVNEAENMFK